MLKILSRFISRSVKTKEGGHRLFAAHIKMTNMRIDRNYIEPDEMTNTHRLAYPEVEARIYKVLNNFHIDLNKFNMKDKFADLMDLFERINLITSIEREFKIVLEENVFENMDSCHTLANYLCKTTRTI